MYKRQELQYGRIPELRKSLEAEEQLAQESKKNSLLRDKVTEEEIALIIQRWTGIPVSKLMEGEREKLLHLEDILHQRVVGQDEAVRLVSEAILPDKLLVMRNYCAPDVDLVIVPVAASGLTDLEAIRAQICLLYTS